MERREDMAVKDHSLDQKITEAARAEFLELGFRKASLRKIALRAGITTGALYTRYGSKDQLFHSLVEEVFDAVRKEAPRMAQIYGNVKTVDDFLSAIQMEQTIYLQLLQDHYPACILFFCKCGGSDLENQIREMTSIKARQTVLFLQHMTRKNLDPNGITLLMENQFQLLRMILDHGYDMEATISCLKSVELFQAAGWKAFLE